MGEGRVEGKKDEGGGGQREVREMGIVGRLGAKYSRREEKEEGRGTGTERREIGEVGRGEKEK